VKMKCSSVDGAISIFLWFGGFRVLRNKRPRPKAKSDGPPPAPPSSMLMGCLFQSVLGLRNKRLVMKNHMPNTSQPSTLNLGERGWTILCPFLGVGVYFAEPGTGGHKNAMTFLKTIHIISFPMALTLFVFSAPGVTTSAFALFGAFRTSSFGSLPSLFTSVYSLLGHYCSRYIKRAWQKPYSPAHESIGFAQCLTGSFRLISENPSFSCRSLQDLSVC
jgi:hypothetical protein